MRRNIALSLSFFLLFFSLMGVSYGQTAVGADAAAPVIKNHLKMDIVRVCARELPASQDISLEQVDYETVVGLLSSDNTQVRRVAAYVLGDTRDKRAVEQLLVSLNDQDPNTRMISARGLGKIGGFEAVPALIALLEQPCGPRCIKATAAAALGRIGDARALNALERVNNAERGWVQVTAQNAMLRIASNSTPGVKVN